MRFTCERIDLQHMQKAASSGDVVAYVMFLSSDASSRTITVKFSLKWPLEYAEWSGLGKQSRRNMKSPSAHIESTFTWTFLVMDDLPTIVEHGAFVSCSAHYRCYVMQSISYFDHVTSVSIYTRISMHINLFFL